LRHKSFGEFVDKKKRDSLRQLKIIDHLLQKSGLKVESFLVNEEREDPYIFCHSPVRSGGFDGVRIYKIGDQIAFRIQKENKTHPYGTAYPLPIEEMFHDFLSEKDVDEKKAGMQVIRSVAKEMKKFFERSIDAEKEERQAGIEQDKESAGNVLVRTTGTDYSALVYNKSGHGLQRVGLQQGIMCGRLIR
jgi:hypothetical protein